MKAAEVTRRIVNNKQLSKMPEFCLIKVSLFNYWITNSVHVLLMGTTWSQWTNVLGTVFPRLTEMAHSCSHLPKPVLWDSLQTGQKSSRETQTGYIAVSACFPWEPPFLFTWCKKEDIFHWNAHFKSSFHGPGFNYCCKKCRNPIFLNQSLL